MAKLKHTDFPTCWLDCDYCDKEVREQIKPGKKIAIQRYRMCNANHIKTFETSNICEATSYRRPKQQTVKIVRSQKGWDDF